MCVSLIVPTLNAEGEIASLLDSVALQSLPFDEIIIVDSSSDDGTVSVAKSYLDLNVKVISVQRAEFNHGLTRHMAFLAASGEIVVFMTQDASLSNEDSVRNLLVPFSDEKVALVTGRQLPKENARRFEQLVRAYNYPEKSNVRDSSDVERLGIKSYFASDVFSAYRRSAYLAVGGFEATDMSEDMLMAAKLIHAGYKISYMANASVYHSHNFSLRQQFERNKAIGYFLERNKGLLKSASEVGEGASLARSVASELVREGNLLELVRFVFDCIARLAGNRCGRHIARREIPSCL